MRQGVDGGRSYSVMRCPCAAGCGASAGLFRLDGIEVRKEQLLAIDLVGSDGILASDRRDPVDECLAQVPFDIRMPCGVHQHDTGPDIAQAIRAGRADAGVATRAVATAAGLDFVPLVKEHFDVLMRQRDSYRPPLQKFLDLLGKLVFAARAAELGGLDVTMSGKIRWAP
jgi:PBP superfamily domain